MKQICVINSHCDDDVTPPLFDVVVVAKTSSYNLAFNLANLQQLNYFYDRTPRQATKPFDKWISSEE